VLSALFIITGVKACASPYIEGYKSIIELNLRRLYRIYGAFHFRVSSRELSDLTGKRG
jgi:hypothetical protein